MFCALSCAKQIHARLKPVFRVRLHSGIAGEVKLAAEVARKQILVVGDELEMRIFLCNLLGHCGYTTIDARDNVEGLQRAEKVKPALIILDVMMPKEGGIQMYRDLKERDDLKDVPVIMVSTVDKKTFWLYQKFQSPSRGKRIPEPGAYLEKPLEAEELIRIVRRLTAADECPLDGKDG
jgi:CheY-like chemotaxis protein